MNPCVINGFLGGDEVNLQTCTIPSPPQQEASTSDAPPCPPPYNPTGSSLMETACVTAGFVTGSGPPSLFTPTEFEAPEGEESRAGVLESRAAGKGTV